MIFSDIHIYPDLIEYPREMTSRFRYSTRPLCNFLQRNVLKGLRFQTTFRRLCVVGTENPREDVQVNTSNVATAKVTFDYPGYVQLESTRARQEYFIDMLCDGISRCSRHHSTPTLALAAGIERFRDGGYVNEWVHAARTVSKARAELRCALTEQEFTLRITLERDGTLVLDEVILRTPPDELLFHHKFKALKVLDGTTLLVSTPHGPPLWSCDVAAQLDASS